MKATNCLKIVNVYVENLCISTKFRQPVVWFVVRTNYLPTFKYYSSYLHIVESFLQLMLICKTNLFVLKVHPIRKSYQVSIWWTVPDSNIVITILKFEFYKINLFYLLEFYKINFVYIIY